MTDERGQMMFDTLLEIQKDLGQIKREQTSQGMRLPLIEQQIGAVFGDLQPIVAAA